MLKTLSRTQRATKVKKVCGDLPETTAFKSYTAKHERKSQYANFSDLPGRGQLFPLDKQRSARGYPTIVNNIQAYPKRCLLLPLARVGARTDSTMRYSLREAWPISAHAHWDSTQDSTQDAVCAEGLHFSAFHC